MAAPVVALQGSHDATAVSTPRNCRAEMSKVSIGMLSSTQARFCPPVDGVRKITKEKAPQPPSHTRGRTWLVDVGIDVVWADGQVHGWPPGEEMGQARAFLHPKRLVERPVQRGCSTPVRGYGR